MMKKYRIYTFIQGHSEKASNGRKQKQKPYVSKRRCTTRVTARDGCFDRRKTRSQRPARALNLVQNTENFDDNSKLNRTVTHMCTTCDKLGHLQVVRKISKIEWLKLTSRVR